MRPLILQYLENPKKNSFDSSIIEYSEELNLSIDIKTKKPAINYLNLSTETFTKTFNEEADSDRDISALYMGTLTQTHQQLENSDNDHDLRNIQFMMSTRTLTEAQETSDSDK